MQSRFTQDIVFAQDCIVLSLAPCPKSLTAEARFFLVNLRKHKCLNRSSNKCHATRNKCLTSSNKKLLVNKCLTSSNKKLVETSAYLLLHL